jgi:hypothetical protein
MQDVATITKYACDRIRTGQPVPGVFEINRQMTIATVIEDLVLLAENSSENEWDGKILYLLLR